jgi:hypothetical protein
MVFGRNKSNQISKSWSDLWDEEESENEDLELQKRREQNSRSWSQESQSTPLATTALGGLREPDSASFLNERSLAQDSPKIKPRQTRARSLDGNSDSSNSTPRPLHESSPKKSNVDKWSELGNRRRNYKPRELFGPQRALIASNWRRDWGLGSSGFDHGQRTKRDSPPRTDRRRQLFLEKDWRRDAMEVSGPSPVKFSTYDGSVDEDLDLVGGWHDLHL